MEVKKGAGNINGMVKWKSGDRGMVRRGGFGCNDFMGVRCVKIVWKNRLVSR